MRLQRRSDKIRLCNKRPLPPPPPAFDTTHDRRYETSISFEFAIFPTTLSRRDIALSRERCLWTSPPSNVAIARVVPASAEAGVTPPCLLCACAADVPPTQPIVHVFPRRSSLCRLCVCADCSLIAVVGEKHRNKPVVKESDRRGFGLRRIAQF